MRKIILTNCTAITLNRKLPFVDTIYIEDNKIAYVGSFKEALKHSGRGVRVYDLCGLTVVPGFIDSHIHLKGLVMKKLWIDLSNISSIGELKEVILEEVRKKKPGEWIIGRGWDQEKFKEKRYPTRWDLDEVAPHNPVMIIRACGHVAIINSYALKLIGEENLKRLEPQLVDKDPLTGEFTGILKERAIELVMKHIPQLSVSKLEELYEEVICELIKNGITTIHVMSVDNNEFRILQRLRKMGKLQIRVRVYLVKELLHCLEKLGLEKDFGDDFLKLCGIKVILDGSLGARTAALEEPYNDEKSTSGQLLLSKDEIMGLIMRCTNSNLQIAFHSIGDKATKTLLECIEQLREKYPEIEESRLRIEHASVLSEYLIKKIASFKLVVCVQPNFIISDWWAVKRVGKQRAKYVYPLRSLIEATKVAIGSDSPVEPFNPMTQIYAAVTRGCYENVELYNYTKNECLDVLKVLEAYCLGGAYASFDEKSLGSIEVGKYADLVILSENPLKVSPKFLKKVRVIATMINGKFVYTSKDFKDRVKVYEI